MEVIYDHQAGRFVQMSHLIFAITLCIIITDTIFQMRKLSLKQFLSLVHTAAGETAGIPPQICEPKPKKPSSGVYGPPGSDLAPPNRPVTVSTN